MKIAVLNGSPKTTNSVTMQYVLFLRKKYPGHEFTIHNVCHDIRKLEEDPQAFQQVIGDIAASDAVIWAFPLYFLLVHGHYKRFIELLFERRVEGSFKGKYAAILTTSIHFFDHTAHDYVHGICEDLGMRCFGGYSAEMYDLLKEKERDRFLLFGADFLKAVSEQRSVPRRYRPIVPIQFDYEPGETAGSIDTQSKNVLIVTDAEQPESNLAKMVDRIRASLRGSVSVMNLHEIRIRGGCIGCIQCGLANECVYREADDIEHAYRKIQDADVLVLAGSVRDRYLSSRWKLFFDRGFFNGHVPVLAGKQIGFIVSGPLMQLSNLREVLEAQSLNEMANLVGIVTDEAESSRELDGQLDVLAQRLIECAATGYIQPFNFLAVGGHKLFRDEIWANLRFVFRADHRFYKKHALYDFPKRSLKTRLTDGLFNLLLLIPAFRKDFKKRLRDEMVKPLVKVVEQQ